MRGKPGANDTLHRGLGVNGSGYSKTALKEPFKTNGLIEIVGKWLSAEARKVSEELVSMTTPRGSRHVLSRAGNCKDIQQVQLSSCFHAVD
jgi:hypothetical protein